MNDKKGLIIITVMLLAILEVLDSTIVNVVLPEMMASLGANQSEITWVLTAYMVSCAIVLPLTGFLTHRIGEKRFLLICSLGFMASSFLCGTATSLTEMVIFRVFQGAFGASLIPISQAILRHTFPLEEQGKAMAIWGLGIMVAPILGPTIGGLITEYSNWRWIFYINLPFCLVGIFLVLWVIQETPRVKEKLDYLGLGLMVIGVASLQIFLDKGNENDWFQSGKMLLLAVTSAYALIYFILRTRRHSEPLIHLAIYRDRNFSISSIMLFLFCANTFGLITLIPIMMQSLFGYSSLISGWAMAPLGLSSALTMIIASILMKKINVKFILVTSLLFTCYGAYQYAHITTAVSIHYFMWNNFILGLGLGGFMVPIATYSLASVNKHYIIEGSGLFSYARMLGTSVGISLLSTILTRTTQMNWNHLVTRINPFNTSFTHWLQSQHLTLSNPVSVERLSLQVATQASALSFIDTFRVIIWMFALIIPLVFLLKTVALKK